MKNDSTDGQAGWAKLQRNPPSHCPQFAIVYAAAVPISLWRDLATKPPHPLANDSIRHHLVDYQVKNFSNTKQAGKQARQGI